MPLADADALRRLVEAVPGGQGVYVRREGRCLVVGREEALGPRGELEADDRLQFKAIGGGIYRVSARLASGRYQDTGIVGALLDLRGALEGPLRHYLGSWAWPPPKKAGAPPRRTSGKRH